MVRSASVCERVSNHADDVGQQRLFPSACFETAVLAHGLLSMRSFFAVQILITDHRSLMTDAWARGFAALPTLPIEPDLILINAGGWALR